MARNLIQVTLLIIALANLGTLAYAKVSSCSPTDFYTRLEFTLHGTFNSNGSKIFGLKGRKPGLLDLTTMKYKWFKDLPKTRFSDEDLKRLDFGLIWIGDHITFPLLGDDPTNRVLRLNLNTGRLETIELDAEAMALLPLWGEVVGVAMAMKAGETYPLVPTPKNPWEKEVSGAFRGDRPLLCLSQQANPMWIFHGKGRFVAYDKATKKVLREKSFHFSETEDQQVKLCFLRDNDLVTVGDRGHVHYFNLQSSNTRPLSLGQSFLKFPDLLPNITAAYELPHISEKYIAHIDDSSELSAVNKETGEKTAFGPIQFGDNDQFELKPNDVLVIRGEQSAQVFDLKTGERKTLTSEGYFQDLNDFNIIQSGSPVASDYLATNLGDQVNLYNVQTGTWRTYQIPDIEDHNFYFLKISPDQSKLVGVQDNGPHLLDLNNYCEANTQDEKKATQIRETITKIEQWLEAGYCQGKVQLSDEEWQSGAGKVISLLKQNYQSEYALELLKEFESLNSDEQKQFAKYLGPAMVGQLWPMYQFFHRRPDLYHLLQAESSSINCRNQEERDDLLKQTLDHLENRVDYPGRNGSDDNINNYTYSQTRLHDWQYLSHFTPQLKRLPEEKKEFYIDHIAESIKAGAMNDSNVSNLFSQLIYKHAFNSLKPLFGLEKEMLSSLEVIRSVTHFQPVIVASELIDGDPITWTNYGFAMKPLSAVRNPTHPPSDLVRANAVYFEKEYTWKVKSEDYSGLLKVSYNGELEVGSHSYGQAPPYKKMTSDGQFVGLVLIGANLNGEKADPAGAFINYIIGQKFEFVGETLIDDTLGWLQEKLSHSGPGRVDYVFEQSHASGTDAYLVGVNKKSHLFVVERSTSYGKEVLYLLSANPEDRMDFHHANVTHKDFAQWLNKRFTNTEAPLVYMSVSCNSTKKLTHTIEAVNNPQLIPLPSPLTTSTLNLAVKNESYHLLQSIREFANYEEIRKRSKLWLTPEDKLFKDLIWDYISVPLIFERETKSKNGNKQKEI